jgi:CRISPR-associated endonuclease/helicase Cas3
VCSSDLPDWRNYLILEHGRSLANRQNSKKAILDIGRSFVDESGNKYLFSDAEERIRTRLGAEGAVIRFAEPVPGPFGQVVRSVTLPSHWSKGIDTEEPIFPIVESHKISINIDNKNFLYDRQGLRRGRYDDQGLQSP